MKSIYIVVLMLLLSTSLFSKEKNKELIWENNIHTLKKELLWNEAQLYCKKLELLGQKWRLPTFQELKKYAKSTQGDVVKDDYYWSSNINTQDQEEILIYDLSNQLSCEGVINSDKYYVLCVTQQK